MSAKVEEEVSLEFVESQVASMGSRHKEGGRETVDRRNINSTATVSARSKPPCCCKGGGGCGYNKGMLGVQNARDAWDVLRGNGGDVQEALLWCNLEKIEDHFIKPGVRSSARHSVVVMTNS